ncbi:MAG: hypothetical protein ACOY0S_04105, partial [Patescibacteria group bacterium]
YLVEAKTLFEYKQYLLGRDALLRSNIHFQVLPRLITGAAGEGKDIKIWQKRVSEAGAKHIEIMEKLRRELPSEFLWQPERANSTLLNFAALLDQAIEVRRKVLETR